MAAKKSLLQRAIASVFSAVAGYCGVPYGSGYNALDPTRKLIDRCNNDLLYGRSTANELLTGAIGPLRAYCRGLERNNPTARAGVEALVKLVVGTGIRLEPVTDNKMFVAEWNRYCEDCGTDGSSIYELQRRAFRDIPAAGEGIWRFVADNSYDIPQRILPLESEWLIDEVPDSGDPAISYAPGIALDKYGNPTTYYLQNPNTGSQAEPVPARSIVHMFEHRRSLQARGEPWFAPLIETLINERQLVDAELYAAKMTAAMSIIITSDSDDPPETDEYGDPALNLDPGSVARLYPGEDAKAFSHTRPSQQIAPFRDMLRGDIAACLRIPSRLLDRDVSKANYSSMRMDALDEMGYLRPVQDWFGKQSIARVFAEVAPIIAARLGMSEVPTRYKLLPDGVPYVDPLKDAQASTLAINSDLTTEEIELGLRGHDPEEIRETRRREKERGAAAELEIAKNVQKMANKANEEVPGLNISWTQLATLNGSASHPANYLSAATANQAAQQTESGGENVATA